MFAGQQCARRAPEFSANCVDGRLSRPMGMPNLM
jgi:hypothetical protein